MHAVEYRLPPAAAAAHRARGGRPVAAGLAGRTGPVPGCLALTSPDHTIPFILFRGVMTGIKETRTRPKLIPTSTL